MTTQTQDKTELITSTGTAVEQMQQLMSSLGDNDINRIPYKDSWTAGQLFRHVSKSIGGIGQAMGMPGKTAERDPDEKIPELKKVFLDFSHKLKSPDFIVPEAGPYDKKEISAELDNAFELLKKNTKDADLTILVEGLPLGPITKSELIHFVLFHTQRHLHQMKKIFDALKN